MSTRKISSFLIILFFWIFNCFNVYGAYEEPEISYSNIINYITVGQKAVINYTIDVPGSSNISGSFTVTGSTAGKAITFTGKPIKIKYQHFFPNGGWHYATASITPEVTLDVVEIEAIELQKAYGLINKAVTIKSSTNPTGYESFIEWKITGSNNASGSGSSLTFTPVKYGT